MSMSRLRLGVTTPSTANVNYVNFFTKCKCSGEFVAACQACQYQGAEMRGWKPRRYRRLRAFWGIESGAVCSRGS